MVRAGDVVNNLVLSARGLDMQSQNEIYEKVSATLVDALNTVKNFDTGLTVPITYSAGPLHDPNHCFNYIRNENGVWTTYSNWNCIQGP